MHTTRTSALLGALALLASLAQATQAQDARIPISKERPAVSSTATSGGDVSVTTAPAVLPAFSLTSYPALTEKNITAFMAAGDSIEIQMADLARTKGTAQSVRDYATMLANDHRAHLAKTIEVITDEDVGAEPLPNDVEGARMRGFLNWMQTTPASAAWDAAFLRFQAQHHQNALDLLTANVKNAHDDDLEELIEATQKSLTKHRDTAKSTGTALGVTM